MYSHVEFNSYVFVTVTVCTNVTILKIHLSDVVGKFLVQEAWYQIYTLSTLKIKGHK